jgi:hypothetical protein
MSERPERVARRTVEQHGGSYTTDVPDLLSLFGRKQLTHRAREEVRAALHREGLDTDPDLLSVNRRAHIRLFVADRGRASVRPGIAAMLWPRSWKGWTAYGVAVVLLISALSGGPEEDGSPDTRSTAAAAKAPSGTAANPQRERARARRERLARRARAEARRERARARRATAARRRRAREREQEARPAAEAEAAAAAAVQPAPADCHASYDPCLDPDASDYDCEGGEGDGPEYTGIVTVSGPDDYDLDRDGDGTGCDS